jgi:hypothetical protein
MIGAVAIGAIMAVLPKVQLVWGKCRRSRTKLQALGGIQV